jgi:cyanophycinase
MRRRLFLALALGLLWSPTLLLQRGQAPPKPAVAPEYGPPNGSLVIVGGGSTDGTPIMDKFIELAGGLDKKFIIVPTAGGNMQDGKPRVYTEETVIAGWLKRGVKNVKMLHTHDPKVANTDAFVKDLREANAVWFNGGRQWNIVDSYANTLTFKEFHKVLERGGVIGGSSAGATIQGHYLVRGDTSGPNVMMTEEPNHQLAFGFLRKSAIDQHINARNRWDHLIPVIEKYPELLGIGLSEGTAIIVKGDQFEVMGKWKVAIHDNTRPHQPWEKPYFVIDPGDVYDMKQRKVIKYGDGTSGRRGGGGGGSSTRPGQSDVPPAGQGGSR